MDKMGSQEEAKEIVFLIKLKEDGLQFLYLINFLYLSV
jgi:hypothetical protein